MKKQLPLIIAIVFFVFAVGLFGITSKSNSSYLIKQSTKIEELQNQINVKKRTQEEKTAKEFESAVGLNAERVKKDKEFAGKFMEKVMTWDSWEGYENLRKEIMKEYKLDENSNFMKVFMPKVANNKDKEGNNYNQIDTNGLNLKFKSMELYNIGISGGKYSYIAFVEWQTKNKDMDTYGNDTSLFAFTIDSDGNLTDLNAYTGA